MKNKAYANFNELVFEDRNKHYGAYVLRKQYEDNVIIGLLFGLLLTGAFVALPYLTNMFKGETQNDGTITVPAPTMYLPPDDEVIEMKDKPKQSAPQEEPSEPKKSIAYTAPVISNDRDFDKITVNEEVDGLNPSNETGNGGEGFETIGNPDGDLDGEIVDLKKTWGYYDIQERPKYPGGDEAMYAFIGTQIVYPDRAKNAGITGTVHVSFVIDELGAITKVELLRGIGGGCDEEAMRVIKKMKRWKPGRQNGYPVKVKFQIPIEFRLN